MPKNAFRILNFALPCRILLFPPTGCSRAHTLLNVHFALFFTVFSASLQCCPGGGQEQLIVTDGTGGDVNVPCNLLTLLMLRHAGVGGMLADFLFN